jgi:hypothetical protein
LRLITILNSVGAWIGRSPGLSPQDANDISRRLAKLINYIDAVREQASIHGPNTIRIYCGQAMVSA